ncbi:MAG: DeoR/GlpR transcriptional regulator [Oscillospiraceae bacterium]|nr:DeoR/GlpR transcriptional regulator [Oscillospiraceae bacterium]
MKTEEREQRIISILESRGEMSIKSLSGALDISPSTLRKQLANMQERGLVIRTYGGVLSVNRVPDESFENKLRKSIPEKRLIAERARALLQNGCTVSLGSGTTVYALCGVMSDLEDCTVYTNSMQAADFLAGSPTLEVHVCGGIIRSRTGTIIGNETTKYFSNRRVDYAFVGCDTIDSAGVVYSDNLAVASAERAVLINAAHKYILCDSTKFGRPSIARIATLDECDGLITCESARAVAEVFRRLTDVIYA